MINSPTIPRRFMSVHATNNGSSALTSARRSVRLYSQKARYARSSPFEYTPRSIRSMAPSSSSSSHVSSHW